MKKMARVLAVGAVTISGVACDSSPVLAWASCQEGRDALKRAYRTKGTTPETIAQLKQDVRYTCSGQLQEDLTRAEQQQQENNAIAAEMLTSFLVGFAGGVGAGAIGAPSMAPPVRFAPPPRVMVRAPVIAPRPTVANPQFSAAIIPPRSATSVARPGNWAEAPMPATQSALSAGATRTATSNQPTTNPMTAAQMRAYEETQRENTLRAAANWNGGPSGVTVSAPKLAPNLLTKANSQSLPGGLQQSVSTASAGVTPAWANTQGALSATQLTNVKAALSASPPKPDPQLLGILNDPKADPVARQLASALLGKPIPNAQVGSNSVSGVSAPPSAVAVSPSTSMTSPKVSSASNVVLYSGTPQAGQPIGYITQPNGTKDPIYSKPPCATTVPIGPTSYDCSAVAAPGGVGTAVIATNIGNSGIEASLSTAVQSTPQMPASVVPQLQPVSNNSTMAFETQLIDQSLGKSVVSASVPASPPGNGSKSSQSNPSQSPQSGESAVQPIQLNSDLKTSIAILSPSTPPPPKQQTTAVVPVQPPTASSPQPNGYSPFTDGVSATAAAGAQPSGQALGVTLVDSLAAAGGALDGLPTSLKVLGYVAGYGPAGLSLTQGNVFSAVQQGVPAAFVDISGGVAGPAGAFVAQASYDIGTSYIAPHIAPWLGTKIFNLDPTLFTPPTK